MLILAQNRRYLESDPAARREQIQVKYILAVGLIIEAVEMLWLLPLS